MNKRSVGCYLYILSSRHDGVLYVGVTTDLSKRIREHKEKHYPNCFTARYGVHSLVYFEQHLSYNEAFLRETQIKRWKRVWKVKLIEKDNPYWDELNVD